jgi:hypothetical protein
MYSQIFKWPKFKVSVEQPSKGSAGIMKSVVFILQRYNEWTNFHTRPCCNLVNNTEPWPCQYYHTVPVVGKCWILPISNLWNLRKSGHLGQQWTFLSVIMQIMLQWETIVAFISIRFEFTYNGSLLVTGMVGQSCSQGSLAVGRTTGFYCSSWWRLLTLILSYKVCTAVM